MVRRHLGFSVGEWDALPWWQQRLYVEELDRELAGDDAPQADNGLASNDDLSALGFNVQ
jgi:hypothetical protein